MTQDVFRRRVFYIPGFDPFPPRRYRELYRTESQEQAQISGYTITQEPLRDVMKLRKGPVIAAPYPVGFLLAQLGFAILCAALLRTLLWSVHPILGVATWGII